MAEHIQDILKQRTKALSERDRARKPTKRKTLRKVVSAVLADGTLVETVYRPQERKTLLCVAKDGKWRYETHVLSGSERLVPYSPKNNLFANEVVLLPSEPEEYESEEALIALIRSFIHRYVEVSPLFEEIASYYVLLTWVYDSFNELPYLRLRGEPGSGKTRFLLIVGSVCYKPIFASGASTVSPIFRMLDSIRGTLIIDEGDFRVSDERAEIVKILNNGNARGFPVLRSEVSPQGEYNPRAYSVFGPKLVATRRAFEDRALESRCLTEEMGQKRLREDIPINLRPAYKEEALHLRNKLLLFRLRNFNTYAPADVFIDRAVEPRLRQVFTPLLSIIKDDKARKDLLDLARRYHRELITERSMDTEAQVLEIIRGSVGPDQGEPSKIARLRAAASPRRWDRSGSVRIFPSTSDLPTKKKHCTSATSCFCFACAISTHMLQQTYLSTEPLSRVYARSLHRCCRSSKMTRHERTSLIWPDATTENSSPSAAWTRRPRCLRSSVTWSAWKTVDYR